MAKELEVLIRVWLVGSKVEESTDRLEYGCLAEQKKS
jgi:hypothetical protein